jgi:hypothetical protein
MLKTIYQTHSKLTQKNTYIGNSDGTELLSL